MPILIGFRWYKRPKSLATSRSLRMLSPLGKGQGNAVASREQNRDPPGYLQVSPEVAEKASRSPVESWHVTINENVWKSDV